MAIQNDLAGSANFGVPTASINSNVYIAEDMDITRGSERYVQKDGNGEPTGQVLVPQSKEGSGTLQLRDQAVPAIGDTMTFNGDDYLLSEVGEPFSQDSEYKVNISFVEKLN